MTPLHHQLPLPLLNSMMHPPRRHIHHDKAQAQILSRPFPINLPPLHRFQLRLLELVRAEIYRRLNHVPQRQLRQFPHHGPIAVDVPDAPFFVLKSEDARFGHSGCFASLCNDVQGGGLEELELVRCIRWKRGR